MEETIHGNSACIILLYLHFQLMGLNWEENKEHHSKEREILVQTRHNIEIYHSDVIPDFEGDGKWEYIQTGMHYAYCIPMLSMHIYASRAYNYAKNCSI